YPVKDGVPRGAYVLSEADADAPDVVLIATGSEVSLVLDAQKELASGGIQARVVSMPSWELFDAQPAAYRNDVLPSGVPRLAVEAATPLGGHKYVGDGGAIIVLDRFGTSAPGSEAFEALGFTVANVVQKATELVGA